MPSRWTPSKYVDYGEKEDNYEWTQTPDDLTLTLRVDAATRAKQVDVVFKPAHLVVGLKGQAPLISGALCKTINVEESTWTIQEGVLEVILAKGTDSRGDDEGKWWPSVIVGHKTIDTKACESTRFLDESLLKRIYEEKHAKKDAEAAEAAAAAAAAPTAK
eukprot:m51a1_g14834 putative nuclear movement protein (161) ;mRNA; f:716085-717086